MPKSDSAPASELRSCLTIDVEDWFHILDSPATPSITRWPSLESRIERNLDILLAMLDSFSVKVTFFWLGWLAERHPNLVRACHDAGHEIASHGYAHVLAYEVGPAAFRQDITRAKLLLEDMTGETIRGFRAPGFSITSRAPWAFDVIKEAGYQYDSSVFPASRAHGGIPDSLLGLYFVETGNGHLLEIPMSIVEMFGRRTSLFGGGYMRLASKRLIKWGIRRLQAAQQPLIIYVHPREIDSEQPRLPLGLLRRFKCYVNVNSTLPKLKWLCESYRFYTLLEMVEDYIRSFYLQSRTIPVMRMAGRGAAGTPAPAPQEQVNRTHHELFRNRILLVESAMADFLDTQPAGPAQNNRETQSELRAPISDDYARL
jgi:polysaccharide deacetylase family protein (PEP-CTERM system associated)